MVLATGELKIWNITARKIALAESIEPIALVRFFHVLVVVANVFLTPPCLLQTGASETGRSTLLRCHVTPRGQPLVTFAVSGTPAGAGSNLVSFAFDPDMRCWLRVADDSFIYSDFASTLATEAVALHDVPVRLSLSLSLSLSRAMASR